jgi:hypothetical protein
MVQVGDQVEEIWEQQEQIIWQDAGTQTAAVSFQEVLYLKVQELLLMQPKSIMVLHGGQEVI